MKQLLFIALLGLITSCAGDKQKHAIISTEYGDIEVVLFDQTPIHRDNFIKLVNEGFYDSLLFHRVMPGFMIQGGDPQSKNSPAGAPLGSGGPGYTIDAEIGIPHFRGMLCAARQGDQVNPKKESSGSQFYIVDGETVSENQLNSIEQRKRIKYSDAQRERYLKDGGTPMLDSEYSVFGEVVSGLEVIDKIADQTTNGANRPHQDIRMTIKMK